MAIDRMAIITDGLRTSETYPTTAEIADAVWDEQISGHTAAGTFGNYVSRKLLSVAKFLALK